MKKTISILILFLICSCSSTKIKSNFESRKVSYEIVEVSMISEKDTILLNELRFYNISSARNTIQMITDTYGNSDIELDGRYQNNLSQRLWKSKKILDNNKLYTISASGAENGVDYFASLVVFDNENRDCLIEIYPDRQAIIDFFVDKMYPIDAENHK
jgi:hypothetical protein